MKNLARHETGDFNLRRIEDNVRRSVRDLQRGNQILNGIYIEDISITSGTAKVLEHRLGREIKGYFIGKKTANAQVWDTARDARQITLNADANVTISLWVF